MELTRRVASSIDPLDTYRAPMTRGLGFGALAVFLIWLVGTIVGGQLAKSLSYHIGLLLAGIAAAVIVYKRVTRVKLAMTDEYLIVGREMFRWQDISRVLERAVVVQASARSGGGEVDSYYLHEITVTEQGTRRQVKLPRVDGSDGLRTMLAKNISDEAFAASHFDDWIDRG